MTKRIANKLLKGTTHIKEGALRMQKRLYRESPEAAFKIEGRRGGPYYVYQVWYER